MQLLFAAARAFLQAGNFSGQEAETVVYCRKAEICAKGRSRNGMRGTFCCSGRGTNEGGAFMLGFEEVQNYDPELAAAMADELGRQRDHI